MKDTKKSAKSTSAAGKTSKTGKTAKIFTEYERDAIQERAKEVKAEARRGSRATKTDGESDLLAKIAAMPASDRDLAERIHALIKASAPALEPKTWYGMPAYAKDGKVVFWFQAADKFKSRYATFGFNEDATLDEGSMWPVSWALTKWTPADEAKIGALVKKAVR